MLGFGPGYKLPGLPHRTGHGIGMDGHEWGNMVKGNKQMLEPGMLFQYRTQYFYCGRVRRALRRLCVYGQRKDEVVFRQQSKSINEPFG